MNLYFVARGWPSEREPQWGSFERDQAIALNKLGHHVVVLSEDTRFRKYYRKFGITKKVNYGIPHYDFYAGAIWGKAMRRFLPKQQIKARRHFFMRLFNTVIKEEGMPDLIYAHYLGSSALALAAKEQYGIPVVGIEHWSELGYTNIKDYVRVQAEQTYKNLDRLISVSNNLRENILSNFGVDSHVVFNMIGSEFYYKPIVKDDKTVRYVTTGNLLPVKGFDNLILAFSSLHLPPGTWSLNIIGEGKEHDNLQQLIDNLELTESIHLCGRKNRAGVIEMLQSSDVYVMSSRSETFGVAATEALACGLPVVATDCGGARDFMNEFNGIIVPVDDVKALADALKRMLSEAKLYDKAKIAEDCHNRFSSEAIAMQLNNIFETVISRK